jgi:transketolase
MGEMRKAYGRALIELGEENKNIVVLDADLSSSTKTSMFCSAYPERFFNAGIAEQNMMGMAAGLAASGKTVFVSSFAVFGTGRAYEITRNLVCGNNLNVKLVQSSRLFL